MHVTVSAPEPEILRDAAPGDLFLVHAPAMADCVCALTTSSALADSPTTRQDQLVVVIGCRVGPDTASHRTTGELIRLHSDVPITRLRVVEGPSLVGVGPLIATEGPLPHESGQLGVRLGAVAGVLHAAPPGRF